MTFDMKEFQAKGYTTPRIGNQVHGGRSGGQWSMCILGDLEKALKDTGLLNRLASELKPGDQCSIGAYADLIGFRDERLAATARVIIVDVKRPESREKPQTGAVAFHQLDFFDLAKAQALTAAKKVASGKKATAA